MFALEFAAMGCFMPLFSLYLKGELSFSGQQIGWMQACGTTSAIVSPLLGTVVVHRWLAPRIVLALAHGLAAVVMLFFASLDTFTVLLPLYFLYQMCFSPTVGLCNGIAFAFLDKERERFAEYRLWGTISWVLMSWTTAWWLGTTWGKVWHIFLGSALASIAMVVLALSLRPVPKKKVPPGWEGFFPREAFEAFLGWPVLRWGLLALMMGCTFQFHFVGVSPQLKSQGFPEGQILVLMSSAQLLEMILMWKLRWFIAVMGLKTVLALGATAVIIECLLLGLLVPFPWVLVALMAHGVTFSFLGTPLLMTLDERLQPEQRAGVHQLLGLLAPGMSSLIGGTLAGTLMDLTFDVPMLFWSAPLCLGVVMTAMVLFFKGLPPKLSRY